MKSAMGILAVLLTLVSRCKCDDDWTEDTALLYGISFGITAVIALVCALSCVHCQCCPLYRKRRRPAGPLAFVGNAPVTIGNGGLSHPVYPAGGVILSEGNPPAYQFQQYHSAPPPPYVPPQHLGGGWVNPSAPPPAFDSA